MTEGIIPTLVRQCCRCASQETGLRSDKKPYWFPVPNTDEVMCKKCYYKYIVYPKQDYLHQKITFNGVQIPVGINPRIGVCNWCRTIAGEINAQTGQLCLTTHMHHEEYEESTPLSHTLELCASCHNKHSKAEARAKSGVEQRVCSRCGSTKTTIKKTGYAYWYGTPELPVCFNCYHRVYQRERRKRR